MELNLDRLNGLHFADFQEKQPPKTPTEPPLEGEECKSSTKQENALKQQLEGLGALQRKADQSKAEIDRNLEVYRTYQENIKRSGQLQTDILKGVQAGEDIYSLFLKAVQAISCMTSNNAFYTQTKADLINIYGIGLQQPAPLKLELKEAQQRLDRLREAEQREPNTDSIKRAIKAHQNRIAELEGQIAKAQEKPA